MNPGKSSISGKSKKSNNRHNQSNNLQQNDTNHSDNQDMVYYAGISADTIKHAAEQIAEDLEPMKLKDDAAAALAEDINYKLRYIINECILKKRLLGYNFFDADDVDACLEELKVGRLYGVPENPNWLVFRDKHETVYHLEDPKVNLLTQCQPEILLSQPGHITLDHKCLTSDAKEHKNTLVEYFETMCEAVISDNEELRFMALKDISTNSSIGTITHWFYHFSYFLLIKDVTYDRLTMRALQLLEVLENSPLPSVHIYPKQLKLLVRLLLQRLLMSTAKEDIVKHMAYVLALFCLRAPLKRMVLNKVDDKLVSVCKDMVSYRVDERFTSQDMPVPLLHIVYYIGLDAVERIFLPNMHYFLMRVMEEGDADMTEIVMAIYGLLCKANLNTNKIYTSFAEVFGHKLVPYYLPKYTINDSGKLDSDPVQMRVMLIKTRKKISYKPSITKQHSYENVFDRQHTCTIPGASLSRAGVSFKFCKPCLECRRQELVGGRNFQWSFQKRKVTVGKTSLLLPEYKKGIVEKCFDHSLISCWL